MSASGGDTIPGAGAIAPELAQVLLERYDEPHRRYHGRDHLIAVLATVELLRDDADDPEAVRLAAWFHDAEYSPQRADNEEVSARLAEGLLPGAGVPAPRVAEVARLVRLTAHHDPEPTDRNGAVLCDSDLRVLAGSPDDYSAYAAGVRTEYAHLSESEFVRGRRAILGRLLERPRLFTTDRAHDLWEERARRNLATELALLDSLPG